MSIINPICRCLVASSTPKSSPYPLTISLDGLKSPYILPRLLFEFRIVVYLDRLFCPVKEGSTDPFLQAAIVPYLKYSRILFRCLPNTLYLGLYWYMICLGIWKACLTLWKGREDEGVLGHMIIRIRGYYRNMGINTTPDLCPESTPWVARKTECSIPLPTIILRLLYRSWYRDLGIFTSIQCDYVVDIDSSTHIRIKNYRETLWPNCLKPKVGVVICNWITRTR